MGSFSSVMRPQELVEHRKLNTSIENIEIPARAENRSLTDKKGLIIYGIALLILLPFLIYVLAKSDGRLMKYGYDNCGNLCGLKNEVIDGISCSGRDYTDKPYSENGKCVKYCRYGRSFGRNCLDSDSKNTDLDFSRSIGSNRYDWDRSFTKRSTRHSIFEKNSFEDNVNFGSGQWWKYPLTIAITITLGILTLVMLRYMPAPLVWAVVVLSILVLLGSVVAVWLFYYGVSELDTDSYRTSSTTVLVGAIISTLIALIVLIVFIYLLRKIGLVIQLYKEATKVLAAMPLIVLVPVITIICQTVVLAIAVTTTLYAFCAAELVEDNDGTYTFRMSVVTKFTIFYNIFIVIWTMRLIQGVQYMIISGSASTWYFANNKDYLGTPVLTNCKITMRFHLGTVAFGSLLLTLFSIVKFIFRIFCRECCCRCFVCCSKVQVLLFKVLSENAYIQTGLHGQSFLRSAKRAGKLLLSNAGSIIAVNCVGDFVLGMIVLILSIIATLISYALFKDNGQFAAFPTTICLIINLIIISITFATFGTIIETLLLCFCEDSVLNDGVARPYFMSRGLMEFVEQSKKYYFKA